MDVLRGATVAGMILVNGVAEFERTPAALQHVAWDGLHLADLVFPFFVFVMGVSIALAVGRARELGATPRALAPRIARRAVILVALGFLVNLYPTFELGEMRVTGVLQRIALVYVAAAAIFLGTRGSGARLLAALALVAGYELLVSLVAAPGFAPGDRSPEGNLAAFVDRVVLGWRRHPDGIDPEGLLSTAPAIATALLGVVAGGALREGREPARVVALLALAGAALSAAGLVLDPWIPINKTLWSGSYVLVTAGLACLALGGLHGVVDAAGVTRPFFLFELLGLNAIAVYVPATLGVTTMLAVVIGEDGTEEARTLRAWLEEHLTTALADPQAAALVYGGAFVLLWTGLAYALWRRGIFLKV